MRRMRPMRPMGNETIELVIQADDFGMCHAVNEGVALAFGEWVVTQASTMAACPWFDEAARLAADLAIPVGLHQTLTCEWDYLRWGPLTRSGSLAAADGTFPRTVADAQRGLDTGAAVAELAAQAARATRSGLTLTYLDVHMGMVAPDAYAALAEQLSIPFLYPGLAASLDFASIKMLSARDAAIKKDWMLGYIDRLGPGRHLLVSHPGVGGEELSAITAPDSDPWRWAEEYRVSDLEVLIDPEIRQAIVKRGIWTAAVRDRVGNS
jgi:hypothetical protein